ncbi:MAG: polysaccharide biosynthesis C-terminal domain-containing protein [Oscillospiraceae bacterium]
MMNNNTYFRNTAVLFAAMAVTKIVGAVFKIPLANILGGTGMGYFSTAYSLYSPVFALTAAGVPTVMMRLTSQSIALGKKKNALRIKNTAVVLFTIVGAIGMLAIWLASGFFAENIACSPESRLAIIAIAPAVLFCCVASVIRGYYEGLSNVMPTAAANITEAVSRAVIGLLLSYGIISAAKYCFDNGIEFLGSTAVTYQEAYEYALPFAAAGAILAVSLSELCGLLALVLHDKRCCRRLSFSDSERADTAGRIIAMIFANLAPIAAFALVMNFFSFIDLITVTRTIELSLAKYPDHFARLFREVFFSGVEPRQLANFMYGSYTGIAMSLFMLVPSFAGMSEKTTIPDITAAWEKRDNDCLREKISVLMRSCAVIGFPACFGAAVMAEPIMNLLYPSRHAEVLVSSGCFRILALFGMFMVIGSALSGVFQAIGKAHIPLAVMAAAVAVKFVLNPLLIIDPDINIKGAAISTVASYAVVCVISVIIIKKYVPCFCLLRDIFKPMISAAGCAVAAGAVYQLLTYATNEIVCIAAAITSGGVVYILLLIITGFFRTSLIRKLLNAKKTSKTLAKKQKIG